MVEKRMPYGLKITFLVHVIVAGIFGVVCLLMREHDRFPYRASISGGPDSASWSSFPGLRNKFLVRLQGDDVG